MAITRLADVIVPDELTSYIVENSVVSTAFSQSGVMVANGVMQAQLTAGANSWTNPHWNDLPDVEANIVTDNPADIAVPLKLTSGRQMVRKSYLLQSWSSMNLAADRPLPIDGNVSEAAFPQLLTTQLSSAEENNRGDSKTLDG